MKRTSLVEKFLGNKIRAATAILKAVISMDHQDAAIVNGSHQRLLRSEIIDQLETRYDVAGNTVGVGCREALSPIARARGARPKCLHAQVPVSVADDDFRNAARRAVGVLPSANERGKIKFRRQDLTRRRLAFVVHRHWLVRRTHCANDSLSGGTGAVFFPARNSARTRLASAPRRSHAGMRGISSPVINLYWRAAWA